MTAKKPDLIMRIAFVVTAWHEAVIFAGFLPVLPAIDAKVCHILMLAKSHITVHTAIHTAVFIQQYSYSSYRQGDTYE